jgi:thiamine biosynthesis lipoprotein ApbE
LLQPPSRPGALAAGLLVLCVSAARAQEAQDFAFAREHVLGTNLRLVVRCTKRESAERAEARALAEIARLEALLSRHAESSELRRWQANGGAEQELSADLLAVLRASDRWEQASDGAFNPAVQELALLWERAAANGKPPGLKERTELKKRLAPPHWEIAASGSRARLLSANALTLDGLAKGYIVDRALEQVLHGAGADGITGALLEIGGDLAVLGAMESEVAIADPQHKADNEAPAFRVRVKGRAVATSGDYQRGFQIGERWYSHIFDPGKGKPAEDVRSATAIAPNATDADALATILCVLDVPRGLELVRSLEGFEAALLDKEGTWHQTSGFRALRSDVPPPGSAAGDATWAERFELALEFELVRGSGRGYRRPYVAAWIEDESGAAVRTLCLWIEQRQWLRDLRRWTKLDRTRVAAGGAAIVDAISRATRAPGKYELLWDGKDDQGSALPGGTYHVCLEVVREHGSYQILRKSFTTAGAPFELELGSNEEVGSAIARYRARGSLR